MSSLKQEDGTPISFGFYATAYNQDFINDAKELANIVHIDSSSGDVNFIISALQRAKDNNLKAIVSVFFLFYNCTASACPPRAQADAFARWNQLKTAIQQRGLIDSVFSFYLDEPELQARIRHVSSAQLIGELEFISRTIKADFPQAKMQMTSSFYDVRESMTLPKGFDIFGLDCYNGWDSCGIAEYHRSIPEYYTILNSKVEQLEQQDGRKRFLALFPPTFYDETPTAWQYPGKALSLELFDKYVAFAKTNPRITAVIGFLWVNHYENGKQLFGANDFPEIREKIKYHFFNPTPPSPPSPQPPPPTNSGSTKVIGVIDGVTAGPSPSVVGWACDRTITSSIDVHIYVGGEAGAGSMIAAGKAGQPNEAAVLNECGVSGGNYRFSIAIPADVARTHAGKKVYVYGISVSGGANLPLSNSGTFSLPAVDASPSAPPPPEPQIVSYGTGCDDNLCLWVIVTTLTADYEIYVRDPQNYAFATQITNQDAPLVRPRDDGYVAVSFRIPASALPIYRARGLEVMLVNKLNNQKKYWGKYFPRP